MARTVQATVPDSDEEELEDEGCFEDSSQYEDLRPNFFRTVRVPAADYEDSYTFMRQGMPSLVTALRSFANELESLIDQGYEVVDPGDRSGMEDGEFELYNPEEERGHERLWRRQRRAERQAAEQEEASSEEASSDDEMAEAGDSRQQPAVAEVTASAPAPQISTAGTAAAKSPRAPAGASYSLC